MPSGHRKSSNPVTGLASRQYSVRNGRLTDRYSEADSIMADVFRTIAIGLLVVSIARPLFKLVAVVAICVLVILFV